MRNKSFRHSGKPRRSWSTRNKVLQDELSQLNFMEVQEDQEDEASDHDMDLDDDDEAQTPAPKTVAKSPFFKTPTIPNTVILGTKRPAPEGGVQSKEEDQASLAAAAGLAGLVQTQ